MHMIFNAAAISTETSPIASDINYIPDAFSQIQLNVVVLFAHARHYHGGEARCSVIQDIMYTNMASVLPYHFVVIVIDCKPVIRPVKKPKLILTLQYFLWITCST